MFFLKLEIKGVPINIFFYFKEVFKKMFKYTDSVFSLKYCSRSKILQMSISWLDYWQCSHNPTSCGYVQPFTHHTCSISVQSKPSNLADLQRWCLHILHPLSVPFLQGLVSTKVPFSFGLFCFSSPLPLPSSSSQHRVYLLFHQAHDFIKNLNVWDWKLCILFLWLSYKEPEWITSARDLLSHNSVSYRNKIKV